VACFFKKFEGIDDTTVNKAACLAFAQWNPRPLLAHSKVSRAQNLQPPHTYVWKHASLGVTNDISPKFARISFMLQTFSLQIFWSS